MLSSIWNIFKRTKDYNKEEWVIYDDDIRCTDEECESIHDNMSNNKLDNSIVPPPKPRDPNIHKIGTFIIRDVEKFKDIGFEDKMISITGPNKDGLYVAILSFIPLHLLDSIKEAQKDGIIIQYEIC
ncbi:Hypothetical protein ORPV_681 [Orpheovirus IHUMI-LCC2]|uniref:Uncharacterized protein n=1 Tax=Orpheovirus IHUMI-LCC2 TaxID=2023057 RepID=A0A2I2L4V3_9VIRU|nr:Hypothetical protein ORPV_681 [Orpheovirus IHUMI-LCC2]SNW62585.1 Hypothetical protein ORPV_681 [Orpheovirus IHUMI-LCC2]